MSAGATLMARKQTKAGEVQGQGTGETTTPPVPEPEPRQTLFSVKGRPSWLAWVDRLAAADRSTRADLLDRALARYAKEIGFREAPPER
jgi:hypothetical protein